MRPTVKQNSNIPKLLNKLNIDAIIDSMIESKQLYIRTDEYDYIDYWYNFETFDRKMKLYAMNNDDSEFNTIPSNIYADYCNGIPFYTDIKFKMDKSDTFLPDNILNKIIEYCKINKIHKLTGICIRRTGFTVSENGILDSCSPRKEFIRSIEENFTVYNKSSRIAYAKDTDEPYYRSHTEHEYVYADAEIVLHGIPENHELFDLYRSINNFQDFLRIYNR